MDSPQRVCVCVCVCARARLRVGVRVISNVFGVLSLSVYGVWPIYCYIQN